MRPYLLRLLTGIFVVQFLIYGYGIWYCKTNGRECPQLPDRVEAVFTTALATVLSLMNVEQK